MMAPSVHSDTSGKQTLTSISKATAFNRWMYSEIMPYTGGRILEIGSGIGNISDFFIQEKGDIYLSDINEDYLSILKNRFVNDSIEIHKVDIAESAFESTYPHLLEKFDSVICINVVEHIEQDRLAVDNLQKLLKPGGRLIVLVPAFSLLYNGLDQSLGHFKRYHVTDMPTLFPKNIRIIRKSYFNAMGIVAWVLGGAIFRFSTVPEGNMSLYNRFVPLWKAMDKIFNRWLGLSLILIGEKEI